jgi:N-acetylglutamate synthase-like GNAT family acetyltransferase
LSSVKFKPDRVAEWPAFSIKNFTPSAARCYLAGMSPSQYLMRRATLEDLSSLRELWRLAGFPVADLERRLTEFQVVIAPDGVLLGCVGLQIENQQGKIHSETYKSLEMQTELRSLLWERLQALARNHGLHRLWVAEDSAAWRPRGFQEAGAEVLQKLPQRFGGAPQSWFTLKLREEAAAAISIEREFELFKQSQKEVSERSLRQARALKLLAGMIALAGLVLSLWLVWRVLRRLPKPAKP